MVINWVRDSTMTNALHEGKLGVDRTAINRALAKAMAYQQCGKPTERDQWARELIRLLEASHILKGN
jgi:hypothetical protein